MISKCTKCRATSHNHTQPAPRPATKTSGAPNTLDPAKVFGGTTVAEYEARKAKVRGCACGGNCKCGKNPGDPGDPYQQEAAAKCSCRK